MAYNEFAYFYDEFNGEADYDALFAYVLRKLRENGIQNGIVADFGCGTGDLTLMLSQAGYDVIAVDQSEEMLAVLRDKADQLGIADGLLLLRQNLLELDLFGTIRAAVSTFDTYSHIGPWQNFEKAIRRAAFFMEKGGVFLFDLNTPYKNRQVLGENLFTFEGPDASCRWQNHYLAEEQAVEISIDIHYNDTDEDFHEQFKEYSYELQQVTQVLEKYGFAVQSVEDGESFGALQPDSQRFIFTCIKQYTQEGADQHE